MSAISIDFRIKKTFRIVPLIFEGKQSMWGLYLMGRKGGKPVVKVTEKRERERMRENNLF